MNSPDNDDTLPEDFDFDEMAEDNGEYNFRQLLDNVIEHNDIIFTVPEDQVQIMKTGLTTRKAKDNQKLRASGVQPGSEVLKFIVYPKKDKDGNLVEGQSCVRVSIGARRSVQILGMELPDDRL